jgi:hypothetical protein
MPVSLMQYFKLILSTGFIQQDEMRIFKSLTTSYHKYPVTVLWASWMTIKASKIGRIKDSGTLALFHYVGLLINLSRFLFANKYHIHKILVCDIIL